MADKTYAPFKNAATVGNTMNLVIDSDNDDDQALGPGHEHTLTIWSDAPNTSPGTKMMSLELVANTLSLWSEAPTRELGTATYPWDTIHGTSLTTSITDTQVVYSNAGVLAGDAGFTYTSGTDSVTLAGFMNVGTPTNTISQQGGFNFGLTFRELIYDPTARTLTNTDTVRVITIGSTASAQITCANSDAGAGQHAQLILTQSNAGAGGDPKVVFQTNSTTWNFGVDNSDSDTYKLDQAATIGGNTAISVVTGLGVQIHNSLGVGLPATGTTGQIIIGGSTTPQIRFSPSSGATRVAQIYQSADKLYVAAQGVTNFWSLDLTTGHLVPTSDNSFDIGDGTTDPRNLHLSGSLGVGVAADGTAGNGYFNNKVGVGVTPQSDSALDVLNNVGTSIDAGTIDAGAVIEVDLTNNSGATHQSYGITAVNRYRGSTSSTNTKGQRAVDASMFCYNTGTTTAVSGFRLDARNLSTGTVAKLSALYAIAMANSGGGTVDATYILRSEATTVGTTNYGVYIEGTGTRNYLQGSLGVGGTNTVGTGTIYASNSLGVGVAPSGVAGEAKINSLTDTRVTFAGAAGLLSDDASYFVSTTDGTFMVGGDFNTARAIMGPLTGAANFIGFGVGTGASDTTLTTGNYNFLGDGTDSFFNANVGGTLYFRINNSGVMSMNGAAMTMAAGVDITIPSGGLGVGATAPTTSGEGLFNAGVIINESGADSDTRIESQNNANMFILDASVDGIGIGTGASATRTLNMIRTSTSTSTAENTFVSNMTSAPTGASTATLRAANFEANHTTAQNLTGLVSFLASGGTTSGFSSGTLVSLNALEVGMSHVGAGQITLMHDLRVKTPTTSGGAIAVHYQIRLDDPGASASTIWGVRQLGTNAQNAFESGLHAGANSAPTNALDVTGDVYVTSSVGIGIAPTGTAGSIKVADSTHHFEYIASDRELTLYSEEAGNTGNNLKFEHNSASPAAGDKLGQIKFFGEDSASNSDEYARLTGEIVTTTSGAEGGSINLHLMSGGTFREDVWDFQHATTTYTYANDGAFGPTMVFEHSSSSPADGDLPLFIISKAKDSGGTARNVAEIRTQFSDVTSTTMDSQMFFRTMDNVNAGNTNTQATLTSTGVWTDASGAAYKTYVLDDRNPRHLGDYWYGKSVCELVQQLPMGVYRSSRAFGAKIGDAAHYPGPSAESMFDVFRMGENPYMRDPLERGMAPKVLGGLALMGVKELAPRMQTAEEKIAELESENEKLKVRVLALGG